MELRQLKYFIAIAEELHFGNAARKLYISQSAISQQIHLLENELGVELFARIKRKQQRKVELTEAGNVFLMEAKKIVQLAQKAIETTRKVGLQQQVVRLGVYKTLLRDGIIDMLKLFAEHFPDVEIKLIEMPTFLNVQDALVEEIIDLGLTHTPIKHAELSAKKIKIGYFQVILPKNHALASAETLTFADLKNEKWIDISEPFNSASADIERHCQQAGFSRASRIVQEVSSLELLGSLVEIGMGIALVPSLMHLENGSNIVAKPLVNADDSPFTDIEINQAIAYKTNNSAPLTKALVGLLNQEIFDGF
jgi:DNA-binding transcriptional LysR family regulator